MFKPRNTGVLNLVDLYNEIFDFFFPASQTDFCQRKINLCNTTHSCEFFITTFQRMLKFVYEFGLPGLLASLTPNLRKYHRITT